MSSNQSSNDGSTNPSSCKSCTSGLHTMTSTSSTATSSQSALATWEYLFTANPLDLPFARGQIHNNKREKLINAKLIDFDFEYNMFGAGQDNSN